MLFLQDSLSYYFVALTGIMVIPKNIQLVCTCKKKKKKIENHRNNAFCILQISCLRFSSQYLNVAI